jgi:hypothetical protein
MQKHGLFCWVAQQGVPVTEAEALGSWHVDDLWMGLEYRSPDHQRDFEAVR